MKIDITGLSVEYIMRRSGDKLIALKEVGFSIATGKFVCVIGPSGCGKSTLLKVLAGLQSPSAGEVLLDAAPVQGPGKNRAMVFQSAALLPWRTVLRNVTYGLELQGVSIQEAEKIAGDFIDMAGLSGFEESYPREISGGMQQRVNLARALVTRPDLLLMDEPFSNLDPQLRNVMQLEVERIWEQTRQTTLFVTHLINEAIFLADEIIVLTARPGRIKEIVPINFPRPRKLGIKKTPEFHVLEDRLSELMDQEFHEVVYQQSQDDRP
ncbi:MAG: ABC transporter ATP-binding protein [Chloroflexi bacterium]|nr:ABC transporter ATP-binding protein [Chloroflexota bacterium]